MLSVKLVRSLVLGETIINNPCLIHHHNHDDDDDNETHTHTHDEYDADDDDDTHLQRTQILQPNKSTTKKTQKMKKKMPLLLFTPTKELISDTFRLATIARDIGMDFYPSPSLSHLLFSWPPPLTSSSSLPSSSSSSYSPISPLSTISSNNRPSVSSSTTSTSTCSSSLWGGAIPNDAVPLPFPSLSTSSSISLLRYFVSLSKGLFKLVFIKIDANSRFNYYSNCSNYGGYYNYNNGFDSQGSVKLVSRVSGKEVESMEEFSRVLAGNGWALFRSSEKKKSASPELDLAFMFRKQDSNRVRVKKMINGGGGGGECRIRELRLPALDFKNGVPLKILQYILLMTDDVFYLV